MDYVEFLDTELASHLSHRHYARGQNIVYGKVIIPFEHKGVTYKPGNLVTYHLGTDTVSLSNP